MVKNESNIGKTKVSKKAKSAPVKKTATRKGKSSSYNVYMTAKLEDLKKSDPTLDHKERMQKVLEAWKKEGGAGGKKSVAK